MAERTTLKEIDPGEYRWFFVARGIILLVFGLFGIILWPFISLVGIEMICVYVSVIFIAEGFMTMAVSMFISELKYGWITIIGGLVSLISAGIVLLTGERSEIVIFIIGGWSIFKALLALIEDLIFKIKTKRIWLLYVKNFFLILLAPLVILSLTYGPKFITLCMGYYFVIHGSNLIILSFFGFKSSKPSQSGGPP